MCVDIYIQYNGWYTGSTALKESETLTPLEMLKVCVWYKLYTKNRVNRQIYIYNNTLLYYSRSSAASS